MPDVCWPIVFQYDEPENAVVMAKNDRGYEHGGKDNSGYHERIRDQYN